MAGTITNLEGAGKQAGRFFALLLLLLAVRQSRAQALKDEPGVAPATHHRKVIVSIPHRKLALVEDGQVKKIYAVAVGAQQSPSPTGSFEIRTRLVKPTYYRPGTVIPPGDSNPLGTRWIGLNTKGYGIHGTNVESSIGKAASHGCIRMHRNDLEELFATVQVGDQVEIRSEDDLEIASVFADPQDTQTATDEPAAAMGQ
jgi:lipoprotein-anchoring transpeptidase ErfK/SrfK